MTYFTCKFIKNVGIGDQLYQLQTLYNLGKSLGLTYVHAPLPPSRWCQNLDLTEFLGLDIGEETLETYKNHRRIDLDAHTVAARFAAGDTLEKICPLLHRSNIIYRLIFSEKLYLENPSYIELPLKYKFDLRKKFLNNQRRSKAPLNPFQGNLISIAVHIRRGDCTWLEDDGRYFFPYMNKISDANSEDVDVGRAVPNEEYLKLLDTIFEQYDQKLFALKIYSDGIPELFWIDMSLFQKIKHRFETGGLTSLLKKNQPGIPCTNSIFHSDLRQRFHALKNEFDVYKKYANVTLRIGSDPALTKEIITAFAMADIAIVAREDSFPEVGLRDPEDQRILMNVKTDQSDNIALIQNLLARY